jgi:peptidoglycan hydrolase-like protein with peptidoglycan-binding domain/3D (Asp-Asp-Asp) domain-containing protein
MNGEGIKGADGTPVYPGMLAAPASFAFGTRIELPGLGVGAVHDRGGAIIELDHNVVRIDVWMGEGEEGLARALAFGAKRMTAVVYDEAGPKESINLASIPAPRSALAVATSVDRSFLLSDLVAGDQRPTVRTLQTLLKTLGYFTETTTEFFGPKTIDALARLKSDYGIDGDGSIADVDTRAILVSAATFDRSNLPVLTFPVTHGDQGKNVMDAQRLLRFLGYYEGRTDGIFDDALRDDVLAFQLEHRVIVSEGAPGAGRIGPQTRDAIIDAWIQKKVLTKAKRFVLTMEQAKELIAPLRGIDVLSRGDRGDHVTVAQKILATLGYLNAADVNGLFGPKTENAVKAFQHDQQIADEKDQGFGVIGPMTRMALESAGLTHVLASYRLPSDVL